MHGFPNLQREHPILSGCPAARPAREAALAQQGQTATRRRYCPRAANLLRDDAQHFLYRRRALRRLENAVFRHGKHAFGPSLFFYLVGGRVLHDEFFDGGRNRQCFVNADTAGATGWTLGAFFRLIERNILPRRIMRSGFFLFESFKNGSGVNVLLKLRLFVARELVFFALLAELAHKTLADTDTER